MSENNVLSINSLDAKSVTASVQTWANNSGLSAGVAGTITGTTSNTFQNQPYIGDPLTGYQNVGIGSTTNNCIIGTTPYYYQPTYMWLSYGTDKVLVTKAENGFVLSYNGKVFIAKNEKEVSKLIVKMMSPNKTNKEK